MKQAHSVLRYNDLLPYRDSNRLPPVSNGSGEGSPTARVLSIVRQLPRKFSCKPFFQVLWLLYGSVSVSGAQLSETSSSTPSDNLPKLVTTATGAEIFIGEKLFTRLHSTGYPKPILFPILAPGQIGMTRNWPMLDDLPGEPHDHPHHKSLWVGHIINGVDFWTEKGGSVVVTDLKVENPSGRLMTRANWVRASDQRIVCRDETIYRFGGDKQTRWIDLTITFYPVDQRLHFEDTKEGTFAVRTHPNLQLTSNEGANRQPSLATARNSTGVVGKSIWGKNAAWVLYQGEIEDQSVAFAMFDHPENFRYPTSWHARDYGLVSANPFGLHELQGKPAGTGDFVVEPDKSLKLRYRTLFVAGEPTDEEVNRWFEEFASNEYRLPQTSN